MSTTMTSTSSSEILLHTTAFVSETLSKSELRRRLFSALRLRLPPPSNPSQAAFNKSLDLAAETLEKAIAAANATPSTAVRSSSLRPCEKLLLAGPRSPFASLLLALIYGLSRRSIDAAFCILEIFRSEPSLARTELAPVLFEELFLVHLLPVLQWYNRRRSQILPSLASNVSYENDEVSNNDMSVALGSNSLSKMSGNQTAGLKELESSYERILDENCRVFNEYFREVLKNSDSGRVVRPPDVVLELSEEEEDHFTYYDDDRSTAGEEEDEEAIFQNRQYNVINFLLSFKKSGHSIEIPS